MAYLGIGAVLVLGVAIVAYGWLGDRAATKRREAKLLQPPDRAIPGLKTEAPAPRYIAGHEALNQSDHHPASELTPTERTQLQSRLDSAPSLPFGHAGTEFATDPPSGLCVLADPRILVADERIESIRELLQFLEKARTDGRSVVIAAPGIGEDVLATLHVNAWQETLSSAAVLISDAGQRRVLSSLVGATPLSRQDLQAGYLPESSLGTCGTWVSSSSQLWLLPV